MFSFVLFGVSQAADEKADPTGTWKWSSTFQDKTRESTLKLKLKGDKLSGGMLGRNDQETPIEDARSRTAQFRSRSPASAATRRFTSKYSGKLAGDTIAGKIESERNGKANSRDWTAKRAK